jgi:uncharacterized protein YndB with AHSA1/START domain
VPNQGNEMKLINTARMSIRTTAWVVAGLLITLPMSVSAIDARSARVVRVEATIKAPVAEVWRVWTTSKGAEEFFAPKANIQLSIGGPYEIYFDPQDDRKGTKGLKILSYLPEEMISMQWNAPPDMPEVRNGGTWVVVQLRPEAAGETHVTVTHLGWKEGPEWDRAIPHFERGWSDLLGRLQERFASGPIDWNKEVQSKPEQERDHFTLKKHPTSQQ